MVENGSFIIIEADGTGSVQSVEISDKIKIKFVNLGMAQVLNHTATAKQVSAAQTADVRAMGEILYFLMSGKGVETMDDISLVLGIVEAGCWRFQRKDGSELFLSEYNMYRILRCRSFSLLKDLLMGKLKAEDVLEHSWFGQDVDCDDLVKKNDSMDTGDTVSEIDVEKVCKPLEKAKIRMSTYYCLR